MTDFISAQAQVAPFTPWVFISNSDRSIVTIFLDFWRALYNAIPLADGCWEGVARLAHAHLHGVRRAFAISAALSRNLH